MLRKYKLYIFLIWGCLIGCEPGWDFNTISFDPEIVVEGWIENDGYAHVILSQTRTLNFEADTMELFDIPIRWAKVIVSDGTTSEILTGRINNDYIPPYMYTGSQLKGEVGKTYTLTIEYSGRTVTAETYIPEPVPIKKIEVEKSLNSDTLYQVKAFFEDNKAEKNYYKFFTRVWAKDKRYYSSFLGTFDDAVLPELGDASANVFRGFRHTELDSYTPFYVLEDSILVKFTQIPKEGFEFWSSYENEVTNGKNILFPSVTNLKSNIKGGLGIWCGYGISVREVIIQQELKK